MIRYDRLPEHMQDDARAYVERGRLSGGFFRAVIGNQLVEAFGRADGVNAAAMQDWARWLYNDAPSACWGSPEKISAWIDSGGMTGSAE